MRVVIAALSLSLCVFTLLQSTDVLLSIGGFPFEQLARHGTLCAVVCFAIGVIALLGAAKPRMIATVCFATLNLLIGLFFGGIDKDHWNLAGLESWIIAATYVAGGWLVFGITVFALRVKTGGGVGTGKPAQEPL